MKPALKQKLKVKYRSAPLGETGKGKVPACQGMQGRNLNFLMTRYKQEWCGGKLKDVCKYTGC